MKSILLAIAIFASGQMPLKAEKGENKMSGIKRYIEDLSYRAADALTADGCNDANMDLVSWHFGDDPAEYIMECLFAGKA